MDELETKARAELAELELLERYDAKRSSFGHDYGNGARGYELMRRRREFVDRYPPELVRRLVDEVADRREELAAAYLRVGRPRARRAHRDAERYGSTGAQRTWQAWQIIARTYGRQESR